MDTGHRRDTSWTIGELAQRAGVQPSAIRYYEEAGVLPTPRRVNGRRRYDAMTLQRLSAFKAAQDAGFTMREIHALFYGFAEETPPHERWEVLAERKLAELDARIQRIDAMKRVLRKGLACGCLSLDDCVLLDNPM